MRKCFWCVTAFCLATLLAACAEEKTKDSIDWAIDPAVQGEDREVLRAALEIVIAECPALAAIDWEAEAKKQRHSREDGDFWPARFIAADPEDVNTRTVVDRWAHFGRFMFRPANNPYGWFIEFSWTEPPGVAANTVYSDPRADVAHQRLCEFNERLHPEGEFPFWFRRIDALAEIVKD